MSQIYKHIEFLVDIGKDLNNQHAIDKLWSYYFPDIVRIVLETVGRYNISSNEDLRDIMQESYLVFRNALNEYDPASACFGQYLSQYMRENLDKLAFENYLKVQKEFIL